MSGPLPALGDVGFALLVGVVAVGLGAQLLRWLQADPGDALERVGFGGLLGLAVLAYAIWVLGLVGGLYVAVGWALMGLAAAVAWRRLVELGTSLRRTFRTARFRFSPATVFLWLCLAVLTVSGIVRALAPPNASDWDSLQYHLAFPRLYLAHHRVLELPFSSHSYFPFTTEMLYTLGLLLRGAAAAKLFHCLTALFGVALMLAWGRRLKNGLGGLAAAVVFLATPAVYCELGTGYIDLAVAAYTLAALFAFAHAGGGKPGRWEVVAGLFAGVCLGMKYTGGIVLVFLVLTALGRRFVLRGSGRRCRWGGLLAAALVVGSPWYVKNQLQTGNPVYPFAYRVFGGARWDEELATLYSTEQHTYGTGRGIVDLVTVPWNLTMWPWNHDRSRGLRYEVEPVSGSTIGPLYLALLVPFMFLGRKPEEVRLWAWTGVFFFVAWFLVMQYVRYLLPCLGILALCVGWTLSELPRRYPRLGAVAWTAAVVFFLPACWLSVDLSADAWKVVSGEVTANQYLARTLDMYEAAEFINEFLPAHSKLVTYGEPRGFYLRRDYLWGEFNYSRLLDYRSVHDCAGLCRLYARHGITHVLINTKYWHLDDQRDPVARLLSACIESGGVEEIYRDRWMRLFAVRGVQPKT